MQNFFLLNENFEKIINKELKNKYNSNLILNIKPITTGWTNIVFKVQADNGKFYFRFPRDEFWERTIVKDYDFAKFIKGKTDFKTPELILGYDENRPFSIHREIPGIPLAERLDKLTDTELSKVSDQISKFLFELHNLEFSENEIFSKNNIGINLNDFIDELLEKHVSKKDKVFWKTENFENNTESKCLVHGDFNTSNVLIDDDNNVSAIIDFGFAGIGEKYFDISRIIGRNKGNKKFEEKIIKYYNMYDKKNVNLEEINKDIKIWNKIDLGYINYMKKIGIYKD